MKLTLGFSPCPNDTFIFDALVHGKVDTEGLVFDYFLSDVEQLNEYAITEKPDITKLSFNAFLHLAGKYLLLDSGAALGFGTGPLLVSKLLRSMDDLTGLTIAIPGVNTTANLLFSIAVKVPIIKKQMLFSDIEDAILSGEVDAGVIIHENRFTYQLRGLHKLIDLGEHWEQLTGSPVPLGGIVAHHRLGDEVIAKVNRSIKRSVEYANTNRGALNGFIRNHAREMDDVVMQKHIDLYVNQYSLGLGELGKQSVIKLFDYAIAAGILVQMPVRIFA